MKRVSSKRWICGSQRLSRYVMRAGCFLFCILACFSIPLEAAEHVSLPDCAADFAGEVVLNAALIDTMIAQAEPGGSQPDRQSEMLLIVAKHYLTRSEGLLVLSRSEADQPPVLLRDDCLPYPASAQVRAPFADFTPAQKQALIMYHDLAWPGEGAVSPRVEDGVETPAGNIAQVPGGAFRRADGQTIPLEAFSIDVYEVSNTQYQQFLEAGGYEAEEYWSADGWRWVQEKGRRQPSYWDSEFLNKPDQPVVGTTWYEADAYCRWAGKTLPTEPQWDKACRGTDGRRFPWGNEPLSMTTTEQGETPDQASYIASTAVGSVPQARSPYGVHDLAGSVLEWTATSQNTQGIVLCGGSGDSTSQRVGCGIRHTLLPGISANFIGFRCLSTTP